MYDYTDEVDDETGAASYSLNRDNGKGNKADTTTTTSTTGGGSEGGSEQYQRLRDELLRAIQVLTGQDAAVVRMFVYVIKYTSISQ